MNSITTFKCGFLVFAFIQFGCSLQNKSKGGGEVCAIPLSTNQENVRTASLSQEMAPGHNYYLRHQSERYCISHSTQEKYKPNDLLASIYLSLYRSSEDELFFEMTSTLTNSEKLIMRGTYIQNQNSLTLITSAGNGESTIFKSEDNFNSLIHRSSDFVGETGSCLQGDTLETILSEQVFATGANMDCTPLGNYGIY